MDKLKKVLIMAGGTGGHVFPGLAIARAMRDKGIDVHWLGTAQGLEARVVPKAAIPLHFISINGLRGKDWKSLVLAPWRIGVAVLQSMRVIRELQPDVVLGLGGFVSGPGGIACWLLRKPLLIHEQNAKPGLTNKYLARFAKKILEGFPNTFLPGNKVVATGNPVRSEITHLLPPTQRLQNHEGPLRVLVIGGSLGAAAINELVPASLANMPVEQRPEVKHQAGPKHYEATLKAYQAMNVNAEVVPFIEDMAAAYAWADLVLCRAGASTIAELCAVGVGAILVPYPYAVDDHQTENANYLVKNGAAILVQQKDLTKEWLIQQFNSFSKSSDKRLMMAQAAFNLAKIDAAETVLKICEETCH